MTCLQLSARTSTVLISCTYLVFHAAFLVINFILLADTESHLHQIAHHARIEDDDDPSQSSYQDAETFLLLPILINVFLITANLLASWGGITCNHLFLIPWLASYFSYILFAFGLLLYMVIVLHQVWFKIVIFLIVAPILIIAIVFWLTVLEFYFIVKINKSQNNIKKNVTTNFRYPTITSSRIKSQNPSLPPPPPLPPSNRDFNLLVKKKPSLLERHRPLFKRNISKSNFKHRSYRRLGQTSSLPISLAKTATKPKRRRRRQSSSQAELVRDAADKSDSTDHHYQEAGAGVSQDNGRQDDVESHYQTPRMSRMSSKLGSKFCISLLSNPATPTPGDNSTMRGEEEITVEDFTRTGVTL